MKVYLICPVRNATDEQKKQMQEYIDHMEDAGAEIYYPARDNPYEDTDKVGFRICEENTRALKEASEIHIFWDKNSQGSLFDLGVAFALEKPLYIVNRDQVIPTDGKSFANMMLEWAYDA